MSLDLPTAIIAATVIIVLALIPIALYLGKQLVNGGGGRKKQLVIMERQASAEERIADALEQLVVKRNE